MLWLWSAGPHEARLPGGGKRPAAAQSMLDGRLVIRVSAGRCKFRTLVDTGAARTLLRQDAWEAYRREHGLPRYLGVAVQVRSLSGNLLPTVGTAQVMIEGKLISVIVVPTMQHDLLMGDDALRALCTKLDLAANTVTFADQSVPVLGLEVVGATHLALDHWRSEFPDVFGEPQPLGRHLDVEFHISVEDGVRPIRQRPYRAPLTKRTVIKEHIEDMLCQGIIQPSTSPWSSPVTIQPKKDGSTRFCVDYRALNSVTRKDAHPLPRIQDIFDSLSGASIFSVMDLKSGYFQVPVAPGSVPYTAFVTSDGLYEFLRMPFGAANTPAVFQRAMQAVLGPLLGECVLVFLDDIVIFSRTPEDHQSDVRAVLQALRHHGLTVKESKCTFSEPRIKLLGYVVSGEGISPDPDKTSALRDMPAPTNVHEVRCFLGMAGYYRQLIPMFSHHAAPLVHLTRKHSRFLWAPECQIAFNHLRDVLTSPSIMAHPRIEDPYKLYTDASLYAVGAILTQTDHDGIERPIQYVSKTLNQTQQKWSAIEQEAFAVVHALKVLRPYLYGAKFEIFTDHKPLKALFLGEVQNTKIQRWNSLIAEYGGANQVH